MIKRLRQQITKATTVGFLSLAAIFTGCNDDSVDGSLHFSTDNMLLNAAGDTITVDVTAGSDWHAESMAEWCRVANASGKANDKLVIYVDPTDDVYERGTAVKVSCGDNVVRLSIRQEPMIFEIADSKKTLDFSKGVAHDTLHINTNMNWKVEIADSTGWLTVPDTIGHGTTALVFSTTDNSQEKGRSTTVRLRYGVRSIKLTASQEGGIRADGHIQKHYGNLDIDKGFNIIFVGDGFIDKDLIAETGTFDKAVKEAYEFLFNIEPYKTYKEYFNVYSIACESEDREANTATGEGSDTIKITAFSSTYLKDNGILGSNNLAFGYASKILGMTDEIMDNQTVVVVLVNDERYGGKTYWYSSGKAISYVPLNRDTQLPGGFTNIFLHEVGGHAIGKLADEWSTPGNYLTPEIKTEIQKTFNKNLYYSNLAFPGVLGYPAFAWGPTFNRPAYSAVLGTFDGGAGYLSQTGAFVCHSEEKSCMINHIPYFSVMCRYGIVQWVLFKLKVYQYNASGQKELQTHFFEHDTFTVPEDVTVSERTHLPIPDWNEE